MRSAEKQLLVSDQSYNKRKRLGQFFTGQKLARLLAGIAKANTASTVVDPMCGTGDMLEAAAELNPNSELTGMEIDRSVLENAKERLRCASRSNLIEGNAFELKTLRRMRTKNFDLVITNPPYVRYQSFTDQAGHLNAPNAARIREDLLEVTRYLLSDLEDQHLFRELISRYSGLSDLAVPSWFLTAMLTKVGGTLALVVPESWLSRDYARVVQYLLLRWFRIRYIVEDMNAAWFPDALVKTTLVVAQRIDRRPSAFSWRDETYAHIRISAEAGNAKSVVGNVFPDSEVPEKEFVEKLQPCLTNGSAQSGPLWSFESGRLSDTADNLKGIIGAEPWFLKCENESGTQTPGVILPADLRRWLGAGERNLTSLEQMGVAVGQGLRTGANSFFYVDVVRKDKTYATVAPNEAFGIDILRVSEKSLRPVVRKQAELPDGYQIKRGELTGRVLIFKDNEVSQDVHKLIHTAEHTKVRGKTIPELSAVRTNIRRANGNGNASSWYMLPPLAPRHIPALLVPRVNGNVPRVYSNDSGVIVDANFSTIWLKHGSMFTERSLLALLNGTWFIAGMELLGSVMGGGALKLEATHLKKIPLPILNIDQVKRLDESGEALAKTGDSTILMHVDELIVGAFFRDDLVKSKLIQLKDIVRRRYDERAKRI